MGKRTFGISKILKKNKYEKNNNAVNAFGLLSNSKCKM